MLRYHLIYTRMQNFESIRQLEAIQTMFVPGRIRVRQIFRAYVALSPDLHTCAKFHLDTTIRSHTNGLSCLSGRAYRLGA